MTIAATTLCAISSCMSPAIAFVSFALTLAGGPMHSNPPTAKRLANMTWLDARSALTSDAVVVIPLGAEAKEHGPHLPLDTDFVQANAFTDRLVDAGENVVVAPALNYGFYPAFTEYPGSTNLTENTARDVVV